MSALQKLAVSPEVGTSRSTDKQQSAPLHPLLQSLRLPCPASAGSTQNAEPSQKTSSHAAHSSHALARNTATTAGSASARSTHAAAALADALRQQNKYSTQATSHPVHQLLATFAAAQQAQHLQQLEQKCKPGAAPASSAHLAVVTPYGADVNAVSALEHGCSRSRSSGGGSCDRKLRQSNTTSSVKLLAQAAGGAAMCKGQAAAAVLRRPVTPHMTKPHKPGSIKVRGANDAAAAAVTPQQHATCSELQAATAHACLLSAARPSTAANTHYTPCSGSSSNCIRQPPPATVVAARPGTAAAFKILRAMGVTSCSHRPATSSNTGTGVSRTDQAPCRMTPQPKQQRTNTRCMQEERQQQQQQGEAGCSRPATAELRALLASSHSKDGIAERLEHYRKLNSSNDHTDGLDIVHEEGSEGADNTEPELPEWLKASAAAPASACQAAPMVLSIEDPCQSTPEVLQQELAQQLEEHLDALDTGQLQLLKDAVWRHMASA